MKLEDIVDWWESLDNAEKSIFIFMLTSIAVLSSSLLIGLLSGFSSGTDTITRNVTIGERIAEGYYISEITKNYTTIMCEREDRTTVYFKLHSYQLPYKLPHSKVTIVNLTSRYVVVNEELRYPAIHTIVGFVVSLASIVVSPFLALIGLAEERRWISIMSIIALSLSVVVLVATISFYT